MISKSDELIDIMEDQKTRSTAKDSFPFGYESEKEALLMI